MAAKRLFRPFCADRQNVRPVCCGNGPLSYRHFAAYNVIGALLWVLLLPTQAISSVQSRWFRITLSCDRRDYCGFYFAGRHRNNPSQRAAARAAK